MQPELKVEYKVVSDPDKVHEAIQEFSNKGFQVMHVATAEVFLEGTQPEDTVIFAAEVREEWLAKSIIQ